MNNQKPCLVETTQGFSVSYKDHLLYSKYAPSKNIIKKIQDTQILPGTIILCISPVLTHGIQELLAKLPEDCILVLCEREEALWDFSKEIYSKTSILSDARILYPAPEELNSLPQTLYALNKAGSFRRILPLEFSAGSSIHSPFYKALYEASSASIMTFWKNRVTLTKFGRKYSRHFFENLAFLAGEYNSAQSPVESYFATVNKPILCFGAGESTDYFFESFPSSQFNSNSYFILCADTALSSLTERGIYPDGLFIEEAQSVILKSFIGNTKNTKTHIFAGLSSIPGIQRAFPPEQISYFFTEFTQADFITRAENLNILPHKNPAFGSVGITMLYYALKFRAKQSVPIFVTGLDFSYSAGRTHARSTPHHKNKLIAQTRLSSLYDFNSAYNANAISFIDKGGEKFYTTQILSSYSNFLNQYFAGEKNIFDAGKSGIPLIFPKASLQFIKDSAQNQDGVEFHQQEGNCINQQKIKEFLDEEKQSLIELRKLLTEKQEMTEEELKEKITKLASQREYLFLHYPDGAAFHYDQSFLNRVRTEIDFFLKALSKS